MTWDYIRQPAAIYEASFATIEAEVDLARFSTLELADSHPDDPCLRHDRIVGRCAILGMQPLQVPMPLPLASRSLLTLKCCVMALLGHG